MRTLAEIGPQRRGGKSNATAGRVRSALVLLAVLALVIQVLCFYEEANRRTISQTAGIRFSLDLVMTPVTDVAQKVGIQEGDRIVELNGEPVYKILDYRRVLSGYEAGSAVVLTVERDGEILSLPQVEVGIMPLPTSALPRNLAGLAFLVVGAMVAAVGPEKRAARLFVVASILLGLYVALLQSRITGFVYVQTVALTLAPATIIHFFLSFPEERAFARSRWVWLLYLPSLVLMILALWAYHDAVQAGAGVYDAPLWGLLTSRVGFTYLLFSGILGLMLLAHVYATTSQQIQRRQLQWIMVGLLCALVPAAVDLVLTLRAEQSTQIFSWLLLGFLPLPITFALAVLRYRLWNLDLMLSRSIVYGLVTASLAAVYLLLVSGLSMALGIVAGSGQHTLVLFVSALVIGLLVSPLRGRVQAIIDRVFFRQQVDHQAALAKWSQELGTSLRFADLARLLLQEVPEQLQVEQAWLLVLDEGECRLEPLSLPEAAPGPVEDLYIPVHSAFVVYLTHPGTVLLLREEASVPDAFGQEVAAILAEWRDAGVDLVLPLVSGGQAAEGPRPVGIYLLGRKLSGDVYQHQEMELLRTLSNQAAIAIANARLYEQVAALSQELERKVQERTKELRDFVSVVYHELSTPITSIRGYNDLLLDIDDALLSPRQLRYLHAIRRSASRLMRLVADLSDVAKIEDGRLKIHPEPLDLHHAVSETLGPLRGIIDEKGLQVTVSIPPEVGVVQGDRHRVVQILTNLVSNACRYTPAGGQIILAAARLHGGSRARGPGSDLVELTVTDTGIGIPRADLEHIFERFYRGPDPMVQEQPGTGLGLSITRSLVELHGSQLWVSSTIGQGSTFGFALPLGEVAQAEDAPSSLGASAAGARAPD
jgi:signal transduction histidine kinase